MLSAVLAATLNVAEKINQFGAYAGLAAIVGLAVLSLLYFSQAREIKRLREWAGRSPERAAELIEIGPPSTSVSPLLRSVTKHWPEPS